MAAERRCPGVGGLCRGGGWSYGVLWRQDRRDPRLLIVDDSYCEEHVRGVVDKMLSQIHMIGEGIVGGAFISGKNQWVYSDTYGVDLSPTCLSGNANLFQDNAEWQQQFLAGIKTIAIILQPSVGVAQFGSTRKIPESLQFVDQVKHSFEQMENKTVLFLDGSVHEAIRNCHQYAAFASSSSLGDTHYCHKNTVLVNGNECKEQMTNTESLTNPVQYSSNFSQGFCHGFRSESSIIRPPIIRVPLISSSKSSSLGFYNPLQKTPPIGTSSSLDLTNQCHPTSSEAQVLQLTNTQLRSSSYFPNCSVGKDLSTDPWIKGIDSLPMEQKLLAGMRMQWASSLFPTDPKLFASRANAFHQFSGDSSSSYSPLGFHDMMCGTRFSELSKACLYGEEKLLDFEHPTSLCLPLVGPSNTNSICHVSSKSELPDTSVMFPQDFTPERSMLLHCQNDLLNGLIPRGDQPSEQLSGDLSVQVNETLLDVSSVSSGLVNGDAAGCTSVTGLPSRPTENSVAGAENSVGRGGDGKENPSMAPTQLFADNDLFDSMELDLNPSTLMQECWDDIMMPVGGSSCSNLCPSVSECMPELNMGSLAGVEKGLFSGSGLEQLLDAIIGENVKKDSTQDSVATIIDPTSSLNSEHQVSTIRTGEGSPMCRNQVAFASLPSISHTSDPVLPLCNLEKMINGPPKEDLSRPQVSPWIDDSCSMNTESAVINHPKKPEEAVKVVKKRARPGESTRPRPKDRQQIQDRVKELREIVPNGAKCSIDALLDRTIKHMLFLQSVTKYADKLKQADEPKMIGEENGVVLKDNSSGGSGGATWAYEVAGQTMVCPIIVEDLSPPGQMLVEMLCEVRGFFLEIADIIRGFGLTILKGVMEIHDSKIWARFLVEANRDVTRMDIFLSLVQLLQQTSSTQSADQPAKVIDKGVLTFTNYQQSPMSIPISLADRLQ